MIQYNIILQCLGRVKKFFRKKFLFSPEFSQDADSLLSWVTTGTRQGSARLRRVPVVLVSLQTDPAMGSSKDFLGASLDLPADSQHRLLFMGSQSGGRPSGHSVWRQGRPVHDKPPKAPPLGTRRKRDIGKKRLDRITSTRLPIREISELSPCQAAKPEAPR